MRVVHLAGSSVLGLLLLAGCAEDAAPPTAEAAWFVATTQPADTNCLMAGHTDSFGSVNATDAIKLIRDEQDGAMVTCSLSGSGTVSVTGDTMGNGLTLHVEIPELSRGATKARPAKGIVKLQ